MRLLSMLLVLALLGGTLGVARGQSGGTSSSSSSSSSFSPVTEECKSVQCFSSVQARQSYAKANSCYFLEDVCDSEGSKGEKQGAWAAAQSFAEGLWDGLGDQIGELLEMLGSPIETAQAVYQLAKAFYDDPAGTAKALASLAGEGINQLVIQATQCGAYDLGKVIGQNVSPVVALKVGVRLARYGGKIDDAVRATKLEVGCASFVAGTPVWLDQGSGVQASIVPIERIAIGQSVLSRNDQLWSDQSQRVENTFGRTAPGYWELQTEHERYQLTEEHPVWVQGKGWTEAKEVREDDVLATALGDTLVRGNTPVDQSIQVYNFSVAKTPSYFVGERGLWVHNAKCNLPPISPADIKYLKENGVKFSPDKILATTRTPDGKVVFLESGDSASGLQHILERHGSDFERAGIPQSEVSSVVIKAVSEGKIVGYQGSGTGRPIYETEVNGQTQRIAVTIGSNGYIVGANPAGRLP
jgi:hypothetical protein